MKHRLALLFAAVIVFALVAGTASAALTPPRFGKQRVYMNPKVSDHKNKLTGHVSDHKQLHGHVTDHKTR